MPRARFAAGEVVRASGPPASGPPASGHLATGPPASGPPASSHSADDIAQRRTFNRVQSRAAAALLASKRTAAHAYVVVVADYTRLDNVRRTRGLTYLPFVARAVAVALREHPGLNATTAGDEVVQHRDVHLGVAVDLDHAGLVVPLVRDAQHRTVSGLAACIADLADRARTKRLQPDDVVGGTFTITNPGGYGTHCSFPIINLPQVAILSTDGVRKRVIADPGTGAPRIVRAGYLGLAYDARAVDPADAARFVGRVADLIATSDWAVQ